MTPARIIIVFAVAFVVTYLLVPLCRRFAIRVGAVDQPSARRVNTEPIPRCGGLAMYFGLLAAVIAMWIGHTFFDWPITYGFLSNINPWLLILGVTVIVVTGVIDDIKQLAALPKFIGQLVSATLCAASGVCIGVFKSFSGQFVPLPWFIDVPLTILLLLAFANIFNLIDGLDGLASGIALIVCCGLAYVMFSRNGGAVLCLLAFAIIGVTLAFLRYNFNPASIFMGDSGALMLGLIIGVISISGVARMSSFTMMVVPVVFAGIPTLDSLSAVLRRKCAHAPITQADRGHIHHRLLSRGWSQRKVVLFLWGCTAVLTAIGCVISGVGRNLGFIILVIVFIFMFALLLKLGLPADVLHHHYAKDGQPEATPDAAMPVEGEPAPGSTASESASDQGE